MLDAAERRASLESGSLSALVDRATPRKFEATPEVEQLQRSITLLSPLSGADGSSAEDNDTQACTRSLLRMRLPSDFSLPPAPQHQVALLLSNRRER